MSSMLTPARPELERDLGDDPRPVRHQHPQLVERAAGDLGLDQLAAAPSGLLVPSGDGVAVRRAEQLGRLVEPCDGCVDLRRDRLAIAREDVAPDRRIRTGHPGGVAKARSDLGKVLRLLARARLRPG